MEFVLQSVYYFTNQTFYTAVYENLGLQTVCTRIINYITKGNNTELQRNTEENELKKKDEIVHCSEDNQGYQAYQGDQSIEEIIIGDEKLIGNKISEENQSSKKLATIKPPTTEENNIAGIESPISNKVSTTASNELCVEIKMAAGDEIGDELKISTLQSHSSSVDIDRRTPGNTLQQALELLEKTQKLLQAACAETTTSAQVCHMPLEELRRDPVLWAAYKRGRDDLNMLDFRRVTNVQTSETNKSRSTRWPAQPAGSPPTPPITPSACTFRPPPVPLMSVMVPDPRTTVYHQQLHSTATMTTEMAQFDARQHHNQSRNWERQYMKNTARRTAKNNTFQQFRLEKTGNTYHP